jgi:hypothetical protein
MSSEKRSTTRSPAGVTPIVGLLCAVAAILGFASNEVSSRQSRTGPRTPPVGMPRSCPRPDRRQFRMGRTVDNEDIGVSARECGHVRAPNDRLLIVERMFYYTLTITPCRSGGSDLRPALRASSRSCGPPNQKPGTALVAPRAVLESRMCPPMRPVSGCPRPRPSVHSIVS